jgi:hypothetical protein
VRTLSFILTSIFQTGIECVCAVYRENRVTLYTAPTSDDDKMLLSIVYCKTTGSYFTDIGACSPCQSSICSCDMDALATHWTYNIIMCRRRLQMKQHQTVYIFTLNRKTFLLSNELIKDYGYIHFDRGL